MRAAAEYTTIQLTFLIALAVSACAGSNTPAPANPVTPPGSLKITPTAPGIESPLIEQSTYGMRALTYLEQNHSEYQIADPRAELRYTGETVDELKRKRVRFQQVSNGVPVWRGEIIVHFNNRDEVHTVNNGLISGLGLIESTPRITTQAARDAAVQAKGEGWQASNSALYVFVHDMRPHLAYEVTLMRGLERWFTFIDARDGRVIKQMSGSPSAR